MKREHTMPIKENKDLMRRFYEEISKGNLAVVDELMAADVVEHSPFIPGQAPGHHRSGPNEQRFNEIIKRG